jgi:hypothetical protein
VSVWDPAAADALDGLIVAAQTVAGPTVHDALVLSDDAAIEVIVVGGSANRVDTPRQEINREWIEHQFAQPGIDDQMNNFTIWSEIAVLDGGGDIAAARRRSYEILRDWAQAIYSDQTLGSPLILSSWISSVGWKPREEASALSLLLVGVGCEAITNL